MLVFHWEKTMAVLLTCREIAKIHGSRILFEGISLAINDGEVHGLIGPNGAGKSTLMRIMTGLESADAGEVALRKGVRMVYVPQEPAFPAGSTAGGVVEAAAREPAQVPVVLGQTGFTDPAQSVASLSGGWLKRLAIAEALVRQPDLLLLDEPTNHLDLEMRQALAVALQEYEGAVVLVSHDRHLLRVVADELLLVHAGGVAPFDGDLEDYARWLATSSTSQPAGAGAGAGAGASPKAAARAAGTAAAQPSRGTPEARKQRKRAQATLRAALGPLRLAVAEQERELERLLAARNRIQQQLALPAASADGDRKRLKELRQQQLELNQVIRGVESAWMEAAARLEALAAQQQAVD